MSKNIDINRIDKKYLENEKEGQFFDVKSKGIANRDLAKLLVAYANSDGGLVAIGVTDNRQFQNVEDQDIDRIICGIRECCIPSPEYEHDIICIDNKNMLLIYVYASYNTVYSTSRHEVYARLRDESTRLTQEEIRKLEYEKGKRVYEAEPCNDASFEDLDGDLLQKFRNLMDCDDSISDLDLLRNRGLLAKVNGEEQISKGAVLLFGKKPAQFFPQNRVKFFKFEGIEKYSGTELNVIKTKDFDSCILKLIQEVTDFVFDQMREASYLEPESRGFITAPEYPSSAMLEAIVNCIIHRDYSYDGDYNRIEMFDDRIVITNPGNFPGNVTSDNILSCRYARNPRMMRILYDFGYVKEIGEGVRRIYAEMEKSKLKPPIYIEKAGTVELTLKNNMLVNYRNKINTVLSKQNIELSSLKEIELEILIAAIANKTISAGELLTINASRTTKNNHIRSLISKGILTHASSQKTGRSVRYKLNI